MESIKKMNNLLLMKDKKTGDFVLIDTKTGAMIQLCDKTVDFFFNSLKNYPTDIA